MLIASLFLNGYLLNSIRKMDFQSRAVTQSASKQGRDLAALSAQLQQMASASPPSIRDLISEAELDALIKRMAAAEVGAMQVDCGPKVIRNTARLKALQLRFRALVKKYDEVAQKSTSNDFKDPAKVKELAAKMKADVLRECVN